METKKTTAEKIATTLAQIKERAAGIIADGQEHVPMLFLLDDELAPVSLAVLQMPQEDEAKDALVDMLVEHVLPGVYGFVLIMEAWVLSLKTKDWKGERPADSPDRTEAIVVQLELRDGTTVSRLWPIVRPENRLGEADSEADRVEGRFVGLMARAVAYEAQGTEH